MLKYLVIYRRNMSFQKPDIIARLQREILTLQGFRNIPGHYTDDLGLGPIMKAFPNNVFPTGAIHEFICKAKEDVAATCGFTSGILASLMRNGGASLWICSKRTLFPPALTTFGIAPEKIIFIELNRERDVLWATEEALKCSSLSAVVAEL